MLQKKIVFVDIETTGVSFYRDRIIEIGLIVVQNGEVLRTFHSLVDPQVRIPNEITQITGITQKDIEKAPVFREVFESISEIFDESIFAAHNVAFDFGFFKKECHRLGVHFSPKKMCTVKLSRAFYPMERRHNLDSIIQRFSFQCKRRHRALDDAKVLWDFYQMLHAQFGEDALTQAVETQIKRPTLPKKIQPEIVDHIPSSPGIYIFYSESGAPLYIGKSKNIKNRVLSHFSSATTEGKEFKIVDQIASLEWKVTKGELGAMLLENSLIKSEQPLYNRMQRMRRNLYVLRKEKNDAGYFCATLKETDAIDSEDLPFLISVFRSEKQARTLLSEKAKQFGLCEKLLGTEKTKKECFLSRLGICKGACSGKENSAFYNARFIEAFYEISIKQWPFQSAIVIRESDGEGEDLFIIDKWCVIGKSTSWNLNIFPRKKIEFDFDVYKILQRYVFTINNQSFITLLPNGKISDVLSMN